MFGDEDDGSGFSFGMPTGGGSKLSSLFGMDQSKGGNESLKYQAPKQPKSKEPEAKQPPKADTPSLLFACACHSFKYVDGSFQKQGKLGAAVLGNLSTKDYKILLYLSQKKPVTNARIHANFQFNVQKNNYASFYDDQSQSWSLCFDNEVQLIDFTKWVALAKYNVQGNMLVTQDLNVMDGQSIEKGDTVEMQYTGWLHAGNTFGNVFDSNKDSGKLFKFKVGKGKVIKGWDTGVIGMKKASKRILVIPPDLAYGAKAIPNRVPANSTLIFQVEVTRVKFANPQVDSDTASVMSVDAVSSSKDIKAESVVEPESIDGQENESRERLGTSDSLKERTKSISDQLSKSPENTKSKLLERMSKMGHAMIPSQTPVSPTSPSPEPDMEVSHSEMKTTSQPKPINRQGSGESQTSFKPESPKPQLRPKPEPVPRPTPSVPATQQQTPMHAADPYQQAYQPRFDNNPMFSPQQSAQLALYQSPQAMQAAMMASMASFPQQVPVQPPPPTTGMSSTEMNLMMTDSRLKHSELKTDLTRLVDKVDAITLKLSSMENLNKQVQPVPQQQQLYGPTPEMEANVLMQNITRIIKENDKLRVECEEKTEKIDKLNERMTDLLTKNQQFFEKSNQLIANQSDSLQSNAAQAMAKVSTLEQHNIKLESDLSSLQTQLIHSQTKQEATSKREIELMATIENLKLELKRTKEKAESESSVTEEHESLVTDLKAKLKTEKKDQKQLKMKVESLEEELSDLKVECEGLTANVNDLKKKKKDDKKRYEDEMEESKTQHEEELNATRQRYKKDSGNENEKLIKLEEELREQHSEKLKQALQNQESKYEERMKILQLDNDSLTEQVEKLKNDVSKISEESRLDYELKLKEKIDELSKVHETQLDECRTEITNITKELTDAQNMITGAASSTDEDSKRMKLEIETQVKTIEELQTEKARLRDEMSLLTSKHEDALQKNKDCQEEIDRLKNSVDDAYDRGIQDGRANVKTISSASYQQGFDKGKASVEEATSESTVAVSSPPPPNKDVINAEEKGTSQDVDVKNQENGTSQDVDVKYQVKRIMNSVFQQLRGEFQPDENYTGQNAVRLILNTIKDVTLRMVQNQNESGEESEEDSEEEEEVSEEEEEEDEEESGEEGEDEENENVETEKNEEKHEEAKVKEVEEQGESVVESKEEEHVGESVVESKKEDDDEELSSEGTDEVDEDIEVNDAKLDDGNLNKEDQSEVGTVTKDSEDIKGDNEDANQNNTVNSLDLQTNTPLNSDVIVDGTTGANEGDETKPPQDDSDGDDEFATDEGEPVSEDGDDHNDDDGKDEITNSLSSEQVETISALETSEKVDTEPNDTSDTTKVIDQSPKVVDPLSSPLEDVGIDSSIFGGESKNDSKSDDENLFSPPPLPSDTSEETVDESSLFFGGGSSTTAEDSTKKNNDKPTAPTIDENKKKPSLYEEKKKSSLFGEDDEDDDDDFFKSKSSKSSKTSAFDRSPPPLFEDDDDDVNWI